MGPEGVVLPAPAIGQALGLSHRGEQLGVEEFVPEPAVERLGIAVLLWRMASLARCTRFWCHCSCTKF